MELERKLKVRKLSEEQQIHKHMSEPEVNFMDLPTEVLDIVASFIHRKDLKNFGLTNKKCHQIFQQIYYKSLDLRKCLRADEKMILKVVKSVNYISLNLNECNWLSSKAVLELVSKDSVRELKLIDCQCTPKILERITKLSLTSLSISLSNNWINFFKLNSIPRFKGLKKLKILYLNGKHSGFLVSHVSRYVLRHCPNLLYLKLSTYPVQSMNWAIRSMRNETYKTFQAQNIPTPVPNLETLILDLDSEQNIPDDVINLVKLILNGKESPLKRIYLGNQTAKAISSGILCSKNISYEKTRILCLSSFLKQENPSSPKITDLLNVPKFASAVNSMLKAPSSKRIEVENLIIDDFDLITHKVIVSGNTSIEEISFRGCFINSSQIISPPLLEIASVCPGINFLDLSSVSWNNSDNNNAELLDSICNLTNLRTLYLTPAMLFCVANIPNLHLKSSFRNLADKCKFIEKLGVVNKSNRGVIAQDVLSLVKFFENLQELHLVNLLLIGTELALPEIAQGCARLTRLYFKNISNLEQRISGLPWKQILVHTKQLKHLSLLQNYVGVTITKDFVDCLVECSQLEKFCFEPKFIDANEVNQYFADNLQKLTRLEVFVTKGPGQVVEFFRLAINAIEETKRPPFYGYAHCMHEAVLPLAHCHLLQYDQVELL